MLEYSVDANGGRAAIAAGYSASGARVTAHRLLTNANVRNALAAQQKRDVVRLQVAREDALQGFLEAIDKAREQNDPSAMICGWRCVSKLLGFDAPQVRRVELGAEKGAWREPFDAMSDAELEVVIASAT